MKQLKSFLLASVFLAVAFWLAQPAYAGCSIDPFPPYPPSPPPFKKPVLAQDTSAGVFLSWENIPYQEGYMVAYCKEPGSYVPVTIDHQSNSILISDITEAGEYFFQVRAFVKVEGNYVFNFGKIVPLTVTAKISPPKSAEEQGVTVDLTGASKVSAKVSAAPKVSALEIDKLSYSFPEYNASNSFYSPNYPGVTNPFVPQVDESGQQIPALLTDAGITVTVERVNKRFNKVVKSGKGADKPAQQASSVGVRSGSSQNQQGEASPTGQKNVVTPQNPTGTISPQGAKQSNNSGGNSQNDVPPEPQQSNDLLIYIVVGFFVLGIIYLVFHKEAK